MLFRTLSAAVYGIDADLVDIEVNLTLKLGATSHALSYTLCSRLWHRR